MHTLCAGSALSWILCTLQTQTPSQKCWRPYTILHGITTLKSIISMNVYIYLKELWCYVKHGRIWQHIICNYIKVTHQTANTLLETGGKGKSRYRHTSDYGRSEKKGESLVTRLHRWMQISTPVTCLINRTLIKLQISKPLNKFRISWAVSDTDLWKEANRMCTFIWASRLLGTVTVENQ